MTVTFLGTRGNIAIRSPKHRRHSAMMLAGRKGRVLIDCGEDWLGHVDSLKPSAILVTHGHPDHAAGLRKGVHCPVYATADTWQIMMPWPVAFRCVLLMKRAIAVAGFHIEAWPVQHSVNAPAVGFRISSDDARLFYVPDVAFLDDSRRALSAVDVYVGDGAMLERSFTRKDGPVLVGHASVATQLGWCRRAGVTRAIFTHCGSAIVRSIPGRVDAAVHSLGLACGIDARVAFDGLRLRI